MAIARSFAFSLLFTSFSALTACGGSPPPAAEEPASAESPDAESADATRPALTAEACESGGGIVVGDIGDGAIHRPEYRCASGAAPTGSIAAPADGPIAIEGSVCCPK